jgi:DNA-binding transcriptional ArsR family regulator
VPVYDPAAIDTEGGDITAQSRKQQGPAISQRMARAYGHPVRARALVILASRVASPRQIAEEIGESLGTVSYHVRELRDAGLIELVETDGSSGGVQHFYRAAHLPIVNTEAAVMQGPSERAVSSEVVINLMVSDVAAAVEAGTFDSLPERVLVRFHACVDARGWEELSDLYTKAMYRSIEINEESHERLRDSGDDRIVAGLHTLVFEMPSTHEKPHPSTLEWVDGGGTPFPESGGSEGRRADAGNPQG